MMNQQIFKEHVIKDDRSYSDDTFDKACKIINRQNFKIKQEVLDKFEKITAMLKEMKASA